MSQQPILLDPFIDEARQAVLLIREQLPEIDTILLDDWNTGKNVEGARLIYKPLNDRHGKQDDKARRLRRIVGEDEKSHDATPCFRQSLCRTTKDQRRLFETDRRFLNCVSLKQYEEEYVRWAIGRCATSDAFSAELRWVLGFRILVLDGEMDAQVLQNAERESKQRIISMIMSRLYQRLHIIQVYSNAVLSHEDFTI